MKPLAQLVRPNILALQPYSTARDEYAGGGIGVWLDANESPYDNGVNRYPDPHQRELKAQLAALKGVRSGQIFLGNGSDEAIDLAFRIFCEPGRDNAVSIAPTYGMYRVAAQTNGVELREVPLGADFSLPVEALLAAADGRTKLLWLCSPNNPTGNAFPDREIEELLRRFDGDWFDVLDKVAHGRLAEAELVWSDDPAVSVVLASGGYPGDYEKGFEIRGLEEAAATGAVVFHAGTAFKDGKIVNAGGRVLGVSARGKTIAEAIDKAYQAVDKISFKGGFCRRDIGAKALKYSK